MELSTSWLWILLAVPVLIVLSVWIKKIRQDSGIETGDETSALKRLWNWILAKGKILVLALVLSSAVTSCSFLESVGVDRLIGSAVDGLIPADSIYIDYDGAYIELPYYQNIDTTLAKGEFWVRWMQHDSLVLIEYLPHDTTLKRD